MILRERVGGEGGSKRPDVVEHFARMVGDLNAAPCAAQNAFPVDDKSAALDAAHQFSIEFFLFDDGKLLAEHLFAVREAGSAWFGSSRAT